MVNLECPETILLYKKVPGCFIAFLAIRSLFRRIETQAVEYLEPKLVLIDFLLIEIDSLRLIIISDSL